MGLNNNVEYSFNIKSVYIGGHKSSYETVAGKPDGLLWEEANNSKISSLNSVAFGNNAFVAVGQNNSILYSSDGQNWDINMDSYIYASTGYPYSCISFCNDKFIVGSLQGNFAYSIDGIAWSYSIIDSLGAVNILDITFH